MSRHWSAHTVAFPLVYAALAAACGSPASTTPAAAAAFAAPAQPGTVAAVPDLAALQSQVRARETAFAKTMADRDHAAFATFVSEEAVFVGARALRGRQEVADTWKRFFTTPTAPFAWKPETVEVLASGMLALTSGPVTDPDGKPAGTFNSIWRREADGVWRVVFDKGCP